MASLDEDGSRLGVESEDGLCHEVVDGFLGFVGGKDDYDSSWEEDAWQVADFRFIVFAVYLFCHVSGGDVNDR